MRIRTRHLLTTAALTGAAFAASACSGWNNERGIGDAPVDQQPDETRKVWPNGDQFANVSAFCIGGNGVYTVTDPAPPEVIVDDPECAEGGALVPTED
jgi:hypothetical protein